MTVEADCLDAATVAVIKTVSAKQVAKTATSADFKSVVTARLACTKNDGVPTAEKVLVPVYQSMVNLAGIYDNL
jgi:5-formaminoimidazole-4-carboxamide-1-beta-D-ribofuranosyl 5'-monophosphate synthetase